MPLLLGTAVVNGVRHVAHAKRKEAIAPEAEGDGGEEQVRSNPSKPCSKLQNPTSPSPKVCAEGNGGEEQVRSKPSKPCGNTQSPHRKIMKRWQGRMQQDRRCLALRQ